MKRETVVYEGLPVGIVIPEGGLLKFIAVKFHVIDLDGGLYESMSALHKAIRKHVAFPVAA
jgi:hypothetical protein